MIEQGLLNNLKSIWRHNMKWHLILMIVWSLLYIVWKIYVYSQSITISYSRPSTGKICDFIRWKRRVKHYIKEYFYWYRTEHLKTIILAWVIYGGFFIW